MSTYPVQASSIKIGGHILVKNNPCKIMEKSFSKPGKHGHGKISFVGIDIFTGKKNTDVVPSSHNVDVPEIERIEYQLANIDDSYLSLMNDNGEIREDIKLPEGDLGLELQTKFDDGKVLIVIIISAMNQNAVIGLKEIKS